MGTKQGMDIHMISNQSLVHVAWKVLFLKLWFRPPLTHGMICFCSNCIEIFWVCSKLTLLTALYPKTFKIFGHSFVEWFGFKDYYFSFFGNPFNLTVLDNFDHYNLGISSLDLDEKLWSHAQLNHLQDHTVKLLKCASKLEIQTRLYQRVGFLP